MIQIPSSQRATKIYFILRQVFQIETKDFSNYVRHLKLKGGLYNPEVTRKGERDLEKVGII